MSTLRKNTPKRAARDRQAAKWRKAQIKKVGRCEWCGKKKKFSELTVHEIGLGRGPNRWKAQDKAYSTLVLCKNHCHRAVQNLKEPVELALLHISRPSEYDLAAHLLLTRASAPKRIEQKEVDEEIARLKNV